MKTIISLSARNAAGSNITKLESKVKDLEDKLSAAKKELAAAKAKISKQKAAEKKTKDSADVRGKGKVSFTVKTSVGRTSTYTKFAEAFEALQNSKWSNGKPCTLVAVTKEGEELLAKKSQKRGSDKPLPAVYLTAKGRVFKNAAGI